MTDSIQQMDVSRLCAETSIVSRKIRTGTGSTSRSGRTYAKWSPDRFLYRKIQFEIPSSVEMAFLRGSRLFKTENNVQRCRHKSHTSPIHNRSAAASHHHHDQTFSPFELCMCNNVGQPPNSHKEPSNSRLVLGHIEADFRKKALSSNLM